MHIVRFIIEVIIDLSCTILPSIGYLDQARQMFKDKKSDSFNMGSSIILLISNVLRIIYWYRKRFELYLLLQSLWMVAVQVILVSLYYMYKSESNDKVIISESDEKYNNNERKFSLKMSKASNIYQFFLTFAFNSLTSISIFWILSYFLSGEVLTNMIGILANTIDCFVTLPQFILICIQEDISYVTPLLVFQWISALALKAGLYIWRPVPWPFILGLIIQALFTLCLTFSYIKISFENRKGKDVVFSEDLMDDVEDDKKDDCSPNMFVEIELDTL